MLRTTDPGDTRQRLSPAHLLRVDELFRSLFVDDSAPDDRTRAVLSAVVADPVRARTTWSTPTAGDELTEGTEGDGDEGAGQSEKALVVLASIVGCRSAAERLPGLVRRIADSLSLSPGRAQRLLPDVRASIDALRSKPESAPSEVSPREDEQLLGVGMLLAGIGDADGLLLAPAAGALIPVRTLDSPDAATVVGGGSGHPSATEVSVGLGAFGWSRAGDSVFVLELSATVIVEARVTAWRSGGGGRPLLRHLGAESRGPLGLPAVEPLPWEVGDGATVHRVVESAAGLLEHHVDVIRSTDGIDVVVSATVAEPAWLESVAVELLRLSLAVEVLVGHAHR